MKIDTTNGSLAAGNAKRESLLARLLRQLPRGNTLDDEQWQRRHRLLQQVLLAHVPGMALLGWVLGQPFAVIGYTLIAPVVCIVLGHSAGNRRLRSFFVTGGLVFCSAGLVVLTQGSIEAHFHFFIIIGFIALYQDWVPFLWNVAFTVLSHGIGTVWLGSLIFSHAAGQANPWLWSGIHGVAVLAACSGMVVFWRITEDQQIARESLGKQLVIADAAIGRQQFASDMLVNLARRNQSMLHRQLDIINQLEEKERDPDALAELFTLDHLATRVRRNAESLLVLAGEHPPRTWGAPVPLRDVVRAAIAETEDLERVVFAVDDRVAVVGHSVADLTHLLAELIENAVRFSPPATTVTVRARPEMRSEGGHLLTVEDWGVGMPPADIERTNQLLNEPTDIDLAVAQRLGFHVVGRLAARHGIRVSVGPTPGSGVTAVVSLPAVLFAEIQQAPAVAAADDRPYLAGRSPRAVAGWAPAQEPGRNGWIEPMSVAGPLPTRSPGASSWPAAHAAPELRRAVASNTAEAPAFVPFGVPAATRSDWEGWWDREAGGDLGPVTGPPADGGAPQRRPVVAAGGAPARHDPFAVAVPAPREQDPPPAPEPRPQPAPPVPGQRAEPGPRTTLHRRVPQSHLAPELQADPVVPSTAGPRVSHAAAAEALSRYQASRQAAQSAARSEAEAQR